MNVFDKGDPTSVREARKLAEEVFGEGWEAKGAGIYNEGPKKSNVWGIGQSVCSQFQVVYADCSKTAAISIRHGSGRTVLPSRKLRGHGQRR